MELNDYQKQAMTTCMDSCDNFSYMMLNLVAELGEFSGKVAKAIRKKKVSIGTPEQQENAYPNELLFNAELHQGSPEFGEFIDELKKEAGDILWQLSGLCNVMGWELEDVARMNLEKLADRKNRGVIDGNGDCR